MIDKTPNGCIDDGPIGKAITRDMRPNPNSNLRDLVKECGFKVQNTSVSTFLVSRLPMPASVSTFSASIPRRLAASASASAHARWAERRPMTLTECKTKINSLLRSGKVLGAIVGSTITSDQRPEGCKKVADLARACGFKIITEEGSHIYIYE